MAASAGRELRPAGADRHRPGPARRPADAQPGHARRAGADPARARWRSCGRIQPTTGGFLEATPLTSFVSMSLAASRPARITTVVRHGVDFLARSVRDDGSWPIDTNLATWATTLVDRGARRRGGAGDVARRPPSADALRRVAARPAVPRRASRTRTRRPAAGPGPTSPAACPTPTTRPARCSRWRISAARLATPRVRDAAAAGVALAARPAEPRRRHADLLPRLDRPALRSQRPGAHRARGARVVRLAAAPVGADSRPRVDAGAAPPPPATSRGRSTATAPSSRCGSATKRRRARST